MSKNRYSNIYTILERIKPSVILEVGTWNGINAAKMIDVVRHMHGVTPKYIGFDLFENMTDNVKALELHTKTNVVKQQSLKNIYDRCGQNVQCELIEGNTNETLPKFVDEYAGPPIDFFLIDGGHSVPTIKNDWSCVDRLIKKLKTKNANYQPVVLFDDYYRDVDYIGCKSIVESIKDYSVNILSPEDYDPVSKFYISMVEVF